MRKVLVLMLVLLFLLAGCSNNKKTQVNTWANLPVIESTDNNTTGQVSEQDMKEIDQILQEVFK